MQPQFTLSAGPDSSMRLTRAVLLYEGPGQTVASLHSVAMVEGKPTILAGKALRTRSSQVLARALANSDLSHGYLPPSVLCADHGQLIWWLAPGKRRHSFRVDKGKIAEFFGGEVRSGLVPHPGLVFRLSAGGWQVWAVKGGERPRPDTVLHRAPYFNVWSKNGQICVGNVTVPQSRNAESIDGWHRAFFDSYFTHTNDTGLVQYEGGSYGLWRDLLDTPPDTFPEQVLVEHETPLTLAAVIQAGGRHA